MKTLLITGGTGFFGNALVERVLRDELADRVIIFSRDELKQARMQVRFDDSRLRFFLGDVRDLAQLNWALRGVDIVVHAASLKRVDRSALDVVEFKKTIIDGTQNVIEACHDQGVEKLIVLSTDKAVEPATPYGVFKAAAEVLAVAGNVYGPTRSCAVRYGNVVGSRGCALETWSDQYARDEPLTITDRRMTRFWVTAEEAVDLVLFAINHTGGGEIFIPKNVNRSDVVSFARRYFPNAEFVEIGKRSYEKLTEVLVASEERDRLVDVGYCFVLLPAHVRWEPGPFGLAGGSPVNGDFQYRSDLP